MVKIPNRLEDLYPATAVEKILDVIQQQDIPDKVKQALDRVGIREFGEMNPLDQVQNAWQQAKTWMESVATAGDTPVAARSINATGRWFDEAFASTPAASTVAQVYGRYASQFYDAAQLQASVDTRLARTFAGQEACFAASMYAALQTLLRGQRVFIAKSDLLRIQGLGNVESLLSGLDLVEVGPVNGISEQDWRLALEGVDLSERSRCRLLSVSPNTLPAESAQAQEAAALKISNELGIEAFALRADLTLSGSLAETLGFPTIADKEESSFALTIAPMQLLLGGLEGALIVGKSPEVELMRKRLCEYSSELSLPMQAANTTSLQLGRLDEEPVAGPMQGMLFSDAAMQERSRRVSLQLDGSGVVRGAVPVERKVPVGGSPWDRYTLAGWAIEIETEAPIEEVAEKLKTATFRRQQEIGLTIDIEGEKGIIDLRFVEPADDHRIVMTLSDVTADEDSAEASEAEFEQ
ncbi:MAG: hypothetical protein AB8B50_15035 [Pirellulaceae bacterium]